jgi:SAM-dependent methyltransferase
MPQGRGERYGRIEIGGGETAEPLNLANRLAVIRRHANLEGARVLDCGCGEGAYVAAMVDLGADVHGIEYQPEKVAAFRHRHPSSERVRQGDAQDLDFAEDSFDVVLMNEVLEHVPDDVAALREVRRVLRPGGRFVLFAPNRLYPFETHGVSRVGGGDVPYAMPFVPYVPLPIGRRLFVYRARNYWPWALRSMIRRAGFDVVASEFVWQTFEGISRRQPAWLAARASVLRGLAQQLGRTPGVRALGASQVIVSEPREVA